MSASAKSLSKRGCILCGCLVAVSSAVWVFLLSGMTGVVPGVPLTQRTNVLFQSDSAQTVERYTDIEPFSFVFTLRVEHPLIYWIYFEPVHFCYRALRTMMPEEQAALVAGRGYNAAFVGIGIGCIFYVALRKGLQVGRLLPILIVNLLSTTMILVALPEHFGISYGVLSLTFAVAASELPFKTTLVLLSLLAVVASGVTITNGLFPFMAGTVAVWRRSGVRFSPRVLWTAAIVILLPIIAVAALWKSPIDRLILPLARLKYTIGKYIRHGGVNPVTFMTFSYRGLIDPVIGPSPALDTNNWQEQPMVTYEARYSPYSLWPYDLPQSVGVCCWLTLFLVACYKLIRSPDWLLAILLLGWITINLVFHNLWGDEFFLYSTHWAWALLAMFILGARHYSSGWLLLLCLPLAMAQVHTTMKIWAAITLVTH